MGKHNNKERKEYIKRKRKRKKKAKQHTSDGGDFQMLHINEIEKRCSDATPIPSKMKPQEPPKKRKHGAEIDPLYLGYFEFCETRRRCVSKLKHHACTAEYSY